MSVNEPKTLTTAERLAAKFKPDSQPAAPEPPKAEVAVAVAEPPAKLVLKAVHDFNVALNGQLVQFKKDQLITDQLTARYLVEQNMPVRPVDDGKDYFFCKHCLQPNTL